MALGVLALECDEARGVGCPAPRMSVLPPHSNAQTYSNNNVLDLEVDQGDHEHGVERVVVRRVQADPVSSSHTHKL